MLVIKMDLRRVYTKYAAMKNLISSFKSRVVKLSAYLAGSSLRNLIILGLVVQLLLAPFSSDPNDMPVLYIVTNNMLAGLNLYTTNSFSYPPLWGYIEFPAFRVASYAVSPKLLGVRVDTLNVSGSWNFPQIVTSPLFNILAKLPLIVASLLIGLIIYSIVKEKNNEEWAKNSFILWFLNPLVIGINAIQGQFDILPALMTVLSFCLFLKRNYFASGVAIGLGALFKLYPLFLLPLYLLSVAAAETADVELNHNLRKVFAGCMKLLGGILTPAFLFLVPLINSNLVHNVLARTQVIPSFGGLTPFSIVLLPWMGWLFQFLVDNSALVTLILIAVCFSVIAFIGLIAFRGKKDFLKRFLFAHVAAILVIYMTSLTVNPQYGLWLLPFLVLSYGLYQDNHRSIHAFWFSALLFLIGYTGPSFFYPLAVYTPISSLQATLNYRFSFDQTVRPAALLIGSFLGVVTIALCLGNNILILLNVRKNERPADSLQKDLAGNGRLSFKWLKISPCRILTGFLAFLILAQFFIYLQPMTNQSIGFDVSSLNKGAGLLGINYAIKSGNYPTDLQVVATTSRITQQIVDKQILIYYDADYPSLAVSRAGWIGLLDHIPVELQLRNYQGIIRVVDAVGLEQEMRSNFNSVVLIPSGVFPATIHHDNQSIVGNWIRAGGTMIWIGGAFAYYSGYQGNVVHQFSTDSYVDSQNRTLGLVLFNETLIGNESFAETQSDFSNALDLRYPLVANGANVSQVESNGGIVLGKVTNSAKAKTAIASIPIGLGHLILFGGGVGTAFTSTGEDVIAHDIAQILCSGAIFSTGDITFNVQELSRDQVRNGTIVVPTPALEQVSVIVAAFSKSPYVNYFSRKFYAAGVY